MGADPVDSTGIAISKYLPVFLSFFDNDKIVACMFDTPVLECEWLYLGKDLMCTDKC